jgi:hypothetical protein
MHRTSKARLVFLILVCAVLMLLRPSVAAAYTSSLPALITSAGQSPDGFVVKVLFDRAKISSDYDDLAEIDKLKGVKTLIMVLGGSAKGLGAAGIDEDEELARIKHLLDKAQELKIQVVGVHIGGESRMGPLSIKFIEASAPRCNYLVIKEDGNVNGYFTKLGASKNIPVTIIKESNEISALFKLIFNIK